MNDPLKKYYFVFLAEVSLFTFETPSSVTKNIEILLKVNTINRAV